MFCTDGWRPGLLLRSLSGFLYGADIKPSRRTPLSGVSQKREMCDAEYKGKRYEYAGRAKFHRLNNPMGLLKFEYLGSGARGFAISAIWPICPSAIPRTGHLREGRSLPPATPVFL